GDDAVPIAYEDIELSDCIFISGANPAWCHPILFRRIEKHKQENPHVKIIVIDPRVTDSVAIADLHLQVYPGQDEALLHGIARCLIDKGHISESFIREHTNGFEQFARLVKSKTLKEYAAACRVSVDAIEKVARWVGGAKGFLSMWTMGLNQSTAGVNQNLALINLHLITGKIGKPGNGPFSLTGQPNAMGGREVGGLSNLLAAHRDLKNPKHRQEVADFWGVDHISEKPGLTATEMFEKLKTGEMKGIWVICTNPSVSLPNARLVDVALKAARFVVVQDISANSDTLKYADLVLPAAGWLEKEGTMTNSERRITHLAKVVEPPGQAKPDLEILLNFAQKMGFDGFDFGSAEEVYDEHVRLTKGTPIDITGVSYSLLKEVRSIQWPVPHVGHSGTKRLFDDGKFLTQDQRANIQSPGPSNPSEMLTTDLPLILTTGRIRDQWHTMTKSGKVAKLKKHISSPTLDIHPSDASSRSIRQGDPVVVTGARGEVRVNANVTILIKPGVVFLPMHWGKLLNSDHTRANNLTNDELDPKSKQPGYKYAAVQVDKYSGKKRKIVVIGAGAAAYRFINSYRERNEEDEIAVFSEEKWPFYNRVLLPEYVNDKKKWQDLIKYDNPELEALNIDLHVENAIVSIDRKVQCVIDKIGYKHSYDVLILATGSSAFLPPNAPIELARVFTMRNRINADHLRNKLNPNDTAVVIGGGLLGLELAAAFTEMNVHVKIVQLGSQLMERQLDPVASAMLREYMEELGVRVYTDDEVIDITENGSEELQVELKSSKVLSANAVIYAIGTRPNTALARQAGLDCKRGVTVNEYLRTSDTAIYALGEIAEFRNTLNGITAAAEQQADVCARYLTGDLTSIYSGSTSLNILKFPDLDLCSIGTPKIPSDGKNYNEITFLDREALFYKKCIIHEDRLVGTILMGDKAEFAEFRELIESKTELSEKRLSLLRSGATPEPVKGRLVCSCNNVGEGNLAEAIARGNNTLNQLCDATGAGLGCGSCKTELMRLLNEQQIEA
ncbi:MAG: FAD-dependent oxidoreductase, partial [Bacteroidota bacterium]